MKLTEERAVELRKTMALSLRKRAQEVLKGESNERAKDLAFDLERMADLVSTSDKIRELHQKQVRRTFQRVL